jgi:tetratricopeptide (TPR) repeat protein
VDEVVYMRCEKDYLVERINNGPDIYCFPTGRDTIVFTDFNVKGFFQTDAAGKVISLRSEYQDAPMPRMRDDEFTPTELFSQKRYADAKAVIRSLNLDVYQLTYRAYELGSQQGVDPNVVKSILEVAEEQYPQVAVVHLRFAEFYVQMGDMEKAVKYGKKALELDPSNEQLREMLKKFE